MPSSYSLGARFEKMMDDLIASGRYNSKSEILRDGLRVVEEREAQFLTELDELRLAVKEGMDSGPGIPAEDFFDRMEARYSNMIKERGEL